MKSFLSRKALQLTCFAAATVFALSAAPRAHGQIPSPGQMGSSIPNQTAIGQSGGTMNDQLQYGTMGHEVERDQDAAYKKFLKEQDQAKKIQLGNEFLRKYPKSLLAERVDVGMMNTYRAERDWKDTFRCADSALALDPDDVDVLTTVGWTIPHVYNPNDADASQELNTAETYAKHAIEVMGKMAKPSGLTEEQFASAKAARAFQAHSALGLVYFRREDYADSAKELALSTEGNPNQDPTDLFILGVDLQNLNRYSEAAAAFRGCSQAAGPLQDRCKQNANSAQAQVDQAKSK